MRKHQYENFSVSELDTIMLDALCEYGGDANAISIVNAIREMIYDICEDRRSANVEQD